MHKKADFKRQINKDLDDILSVLEGEDDFNAAAGFDVNIYRIGKTKPMLRSLRVCINDRLEEL